MPPVLGVVLRGADDGVDRAGVERLGDGVAARPVAGRGERPGDLAGVTLPRARSRGLGVRDGVRTGLAGVSATLVPNSFIFFCLKKPAAAFLIEDGTELAAILFVTAGTL